MKTCEHCEFFAVDPDARDARGVSVFGGQRGQCRAAPPTVMLVPHKSIAGDRIVPASVWPGVEGDAWCGQFKERETCNR